LVSRPSNLLFASFVIFRHHLTLLSIRKLVIMSSSFEAAPGPSSSNDQELVSQATNHIQQGKRHLLVRDFSLAVQSLEEGCKLLDRKYGINADECVEGYFFYGLALFELARQETGALNGVGDSNNAGEASDDEEEEEEEEGEDEVDDVEAAAANTTTTTTGEAEAAPVDTGVIDKGDFEEDITRSPRTEENEHDEQEVGSSSDMMVDIDPNQPSTSSGVTDASRAAAVADEEDAEDGGANTIEVAWEVLNMAKNIFMRQLQYKDNVHLNLAETAQKLGEIMLEWENFDKALEELKYSLEIRQQKLPADHRLIAETYYHIGLALSFKHDLEAAEQSFRKALDVIEHRIQVKQQELTAGIHLTEEDRSKLEAEIAELQGLLPEMRFKIEDCQEQKRTGGPLAAKVEAEESEKLEQQIIDQKTRDNQFKPVTNLTHLVKRKRDELDDSISKKLRSQSNGNHEHGVQANGTSNGHSQNGHSSIGDLNGKPAADLDESMAE